MKAKELATALMETPDADVHVVGGAGLMEVTGLATLRTVKKPWRYLGYPVFFISRRANSVRLTILAGDQEKQDNVREALT